MEKPFLKTPYFLLFLFIISNVNAQEVKVDAVIKVTNQCPFALWSHGFASDRYTGIWSGLHGGVAEELPSGSTIIYSSLPTMGGGRIYAYYKLPDVMVSQSAPLSPYNQFVEFTIDNNAMNYNISYVDHASLPVSVKAEKYDPLLGECGETAASYCYDEWQSLMVKCPTTLINEYNGISSCISSYEYCLYYAAGSDYCNKMKVYQYTALDGEILSFDGYRIYGEDFDATTKMKIYKGNETSPEALAFWDQVAAWNRGTYSGNNNDADYFNGPQQIDGSWYKPYNEYAKWIHEDIGSEIYSFSTDDHQGKSGFVRCMDSKVLDIVWCPCETLPVEVSLFESRREQEHTVFVWETKNEINMDYFQIERSIDGKNFGSIANVRAGGKNSGGTNYKAIDPHPIEGENYYRLKQVNLDGSFSYSRLISVDFTQEKLLHIFPNPVISDLHIKLYDLSGTRFYIEDVLGRKLFESEVEEGIEKIDLNVRDFPAGAYTIIFIPRQGEAKYNWFVKE